MVITATDFTSGSAPDAELKFNVERLDVVRNHLRNMPHEMLNLNVWTQEDACGSVCCVIGYATQFMDVQSRGLIMNDRAGQPEFEDRLGIPAVAVWLNMDVETTRRIFTSAHYADGLTPLQLKTHILGRLQLKIAVPVSTYLTGWLASRWRYQDRAVKAIIANGGEVDAFVANPIQNHAGAAVVGVYRKGDGLHLANANLAVVERKLESDVVPDLYFG